MVVETKTHTALDPSDLSRSVAVASDEAISVAMVTWFAH
jgi:hypothetical protein